MYLFWMLFSTIFKKKLISNLGLYFFRYQMSQKLLKFSLSKILVLILEKERTALYYQIPTSTIKWTYGVKLPKYDPTLLSYYCKYKNISFYMFIGDIISRQTTAINFEILQFNYKKLFLELLFDIETSHLISLLLRPMNCWKNCSHCA